MSLLWAMLPVYLFGNVHCFGMCGPLVMMIGRHKYRSLYFLGRIVSFTLAGLISGSIGFVLQGFMSTYHLSSFISLFFGLLLILLGFSHLNLLSFPSFPYLAKKIHKTNQRLSYLILQDKPLPTALFGFFTILLPCGQTLIVFSACALVGDPWTGAFNGFIFALLTTPSLFMAMSLTKLVAQYKHLSNQVLACTAFIVGAIACLRGLAELNIIPHFSLSTKYHLIIW